MALNKAARGIPHYQISPKLLDWKDDRANAEAQLAILNRNLWRMANAIRRIDRVPDDIAGLSDLEDALLKDGSRPLEGDMAVDPGVKIDGVDIGEAGLQSMSMSLTDGVTAPYWTTAASAVSHRTRFPGTDVMTPSLVKIIAAQAAPAGTFDLDIFDETNSLAVFNETFTPAAVGVIELFTSTNALTNLSTAEAIWRFTWTNTTATDLQVSFVTVLQ